MFNYSIKVFPFQSQSKTRAFASVVVDDVMEVKGFKVIEGSKGLFVSAPQTKGVDKETKEDRWYPDVYFQEDRDPDNGVYQGPVEKELFAAILDAYKAKVNYQERGAAASANSNQGSSRSSSPFGDGPAW